MATKEDVELWVLEYACRYQHAEAIQGICKRRNGSVLGFNMPPIRLAEGTLCLIVGHEEFDDFAVAIQLVEEIYNGSGDLVPFKLFAKLSSGLKIKSLLHMLATRQNNILEKLNEYFPRSGLNHQNASKKTLAHLNTSQFQFRKFFLPLLANENQRLAYLRDEYLLTFGNSFVNRLKELVKEFIGAVEEHLPPTFLEKLMTASKDGLDLERKLREQAVFCPVLEIVLDTVLGQTTLTGQSLQELLTMVSPLNTQDRLITSHPDPFTHHVDSFSEDSGTDQTPPVDGEEALQERGQHRTRLPCKRGKCFDSETASKRLPHSSSPLCKWGASETVGRMSSQMAPGPSCSSQEACRDRLSGGCDSVLMSTAQGEHQLPASSSVEHGYTDTDMCTRQDRLHQDSRKNDRLLGGHAQSVTAKGTSVTKTSNTWCGVPLSPVRGLVADEIVSEESLWRRGDNYGRTTMDMCSDGHFTEHTSSGRRQSEAKRKFPVTSDLLKTTASCGQACVKCVSPVKPREEPQKSWHEDSSSDEEVIELSDCSEKCGEQVLLPRAGTRRSLCLADSGSISDIDRSSDCDIDQDVVSGSEENESPMGVNDWQAGTGKPESSILTQLISPYRKSSALKLCVIKLFRDKSHVLDEKTGASVELYS
ncbi:uncharacterized protein LOC135465712 isoform X2 [Liolophura sinensis]|uniref:uncharacterized protein LOC135465712 isoform X2 n=1 Tax=Liolophura sinensis TaxID=3198878 RepID=UPI0031585363